MAEKDYRIERDSMGEVRVPKTAYYGAQTKRAVENFRSAVPASRRHSSIRSVWLNMPRP